MKNSARQRASRFLSAFGLATLLFLNLPARAQQTNANDYFLNAQLLDLNGRLQLTTTGFSTEVGEAASNGNRTAWFVWTAPQDTPAQVRFSTYGSNYNTVISLYSKPAGSAPLITSLLPVTTAPENPIIIDDDPNLPAINTGHLTWSPQAGATYYIAVGRAGGGGGNSTLEGTFGAVVAVDGTTAVIPNDDIAGALEFVPVVTLPASYASETNSAGAKKDSTIVAV